MEVIGEFQTSVRRALAEIDPLWDSRDGLVVCGTHSPTRDVAEINHILGRIKEAREEGRGYLGICYGYQMASIEYARNVLGIEDATSEEFGEGTFVVKKKDKLNVGLHGGQTYWNNYEVVIDWEPPENFVTTQFHPEYQSSIDKPHPLLTKFISLCNAE